MGERCFTQTVHPSRGIPDAGMGVLPRLVYEVNPDASVMCVGSALGQIAAQHGSQPLNVWLPQHGEVVSWYGMDLDRSSR